MGTRRQAREQALSLLYAVDLSGTTPEEAIRLQWAEEAPDPDIVEFAGMLVRGVSAQRVRIDELISAASTNWKIGRMSFVDRNIIRIAVFEMLEQEDIPTMVSVNEAIELGKRFGTTDSGSFINGVLDRVARNLDIVPDRKR